jgi:hypothetical protein
MAHPLWRHMLEESKRQALKAMDEYNASTGNYADFVGQMVRAWLYLLHAEFRHQRIDYHYVDSATGKHKIIDGEPKAWELATCLAQRYPYPNDPVRKNIEFFIPLRNKIEHRYQRVIQVVTGGRAHALVINFEAEVVSYFGSAHSMADRLRFPIFLQSLSEPDLPEVRRLQKRVPKSTSSYITSFESELSSKVLDDVRYDYRVRLIPISGPKTDADLAVNFVDLAKVSEEERVTLLEAGRQGKVITKAKHVEVASKDKILPKKVVKQVNERVPYTFTMDHHTKLWKHFAIRPSGRSGDRALTDAKYCVYDEPFQSYVYTPAWVEKIIREAGTAEDLRKLLGLSRLPRNKVTALDEVRAKRAAQDEGSGAESAAGTPARP